MNNIRIAFFLVPVVLTAGCIFQKAYSTVSPVNSVQAVDLRSIHSGLGSLLKTGQTYIAQVKGSVTDGQMNWFVENPPMPHHYAVGFEWSNLADAGNPRDGMWTFVVKDIERWHDKERGGEMGTYIARYKCEVLRIEDQGKKQ